MQLSFKKSIQLMLVVALALVVVQRFQSSIAFSAQETETTNQLDLTDQQTGIFERVFSFFRAPEEVDAVNLEGGKAIGEESEEVDGLTTTPIRAVELFKPGDEEKRAYRQFFGKVVANETAVLSFPLSGTLKRFPVTEGQIVEKGSLLAELDLGSFQRAKERARVTLEQADRQLDRENRLLESSVVSERRLEETQTASDLADIALRDAKDALEDATLLAPYRALIAERLTANHVIVEPGTPIVEVHDISSLRVEIELPERLLRQINDISAVEFSALVPGLTVPAILEVVEFQPKTGTVGQTFTVSLALPKKAITSILPGVSLTVTATLPNRETPTLLPPTAISVDANKQTYVMVFESENLKEGVVRKQEVEVTTEDGLSFLVSDLPPSIEIVRVGAHLLREGQKVRRYSGLIVGE